MIGILFALLVAFGPEGRLTPCYGISFSLSLLMWFSSAGRTAPPANQLCNIHLAQRCCCGAAGCQPLPLIAPVSHVEARGGKRKKKESEYVVNLSDKLDTETIGRKKHGRRLISLDCG